jgi:hypothetical protein
MFAQLSTEFGPKLINVDQIRSIAVARYSVSGSTLGPFRWNLTIHLPESENVVLADFPDEDAALAVARGLVDDDNIKEV